MIWAGILLFIAGACVYVSVYFASPYHFEALKLPITLTPGTIRTPEFTTDLEDEYSVSLQFDRRSRIPKLECYLGALAAPPESCEGIPQLIDASWKLLDNSGTVAEGDLRREMGSVARYRTDSEGRLVGPPEYRQIASIRYADGLELIIGYFRAMKSHRYILELSVKKDASFLRRASPRLVVRIPPERNEGYALKAVGTQIRGISLSAFGLLILVVTFCGRMLARRRARRTAVTT
jgi:hypothetical protein